MMGRLSIVFGRIRAFSKMRQFAVFLMLAIAAGGVGSAIAWVALYRAPDVSSLRLVLVLPTSQSEAGLVQSFSQGASLFVKRRLGQRHLDIEPIEGDEASLRRAAADPNVVAAIGLTADTNRPDPAAYGLPTLYASTSGTVSTPPRLGLSADPIFEARFLANYVRNVLGEKLVSIIVPQDAAWSRVADAFDETLQRFGTRVVYRWALPSVAEPGGLRFEDVGSAIKDKMIAGDILILGPPEFAAKSVAALGAARIANPIIGLRDIGSTAFREELQRIWTGPASLSAMMNNIIFTSPVLFDVAGVGAQGFRDDYLTAFHNPPDWSALLGYDAVAMLTQTIDAMKGGKRDVGTSLRAELASTLATLTSPHKAIAGLSGPLFFQARNGGALPTWIGRYDGREIVAAETQLTPIRDEGVTNYLDQLTSGKALYVNDRFMYKTNVVSAGIGLNKIGEPNLDTNSMDAEFTIWFRWRGSVPATDIVFENAARPVVLGEPVRSRDDGDLHYRAWRTSGKFFLNVADVPHPYASQLATIAFRHRTLARNNLMYVVDFVGLGLSDTPNTTEQPQSLMGRLFGLERDGTSALLRQLQTARVTAGAPGFLLDKAVIAQDLTHAGSEGDPSYVGYGKPAPDFSRLSLHSEIVRDTFDLRGLLPQSLLAYLAIFALSAAVLAHILDRRDRGQFWRMQTLGLRLLSWPVLLASVSALSLDYMSQNYASSFTDIMDFVFKALWWLAPAWLASLTVERFVWVPLEKRTARKVPTVFRMIIAILIYLLAGFGIVSFVLNKPITSLLATSGLITLIVGLAVQSNLKDIFSGVMLNLERPFLIGDWVRVNRMVAAEVIDVSWRTTRLRTNNGQVIALANGKVADSEIENLTRAGFYEVPCDVFVDTRAEPTEVIKAIQMAVTKLGEKFDFTVYRLGLMKIENVNGTWAGRYVVEFRVADYKMRNKLILAFWTRIWEELSQAGLTWALAPSGTDNELENIA